MPGAGDSAAITTTGSYTVTVNDTESVGTLTLGASTGDASVQTLGVSSGTLTVGNASSGTVQGALGISGGTLAAGGTLTLAGPLNWTGGTVMGTIQFAGGSVSSVNWNAILVNTGTLALSGNLYMYAGQLTNLPSGTVNVAAGTSMGTENGSPLIENAGQFNLAGPGTTSINIPFFNTGTVAVNGGTLELGGGGTESGSFTVATGATLEVGAGAFSLTSGCAISGTGNLTVGGGTANVTNNCTITTPLVISSGTLNLDGSGTVTPPSLTVSGGAEGGSQTLQVNGPLNWTAGNITGTVQFEGGSITGLNWSGILVNSGTLALSGNFYMYGGQLTNLASGTVNVAAGTFMGLENGAPVIENAGQFNVAGPGTTTINVSFFNTGAVAVDGGTLSLGNGGTESGPFTMASGTTLQLSGSTFSLTSGCAISGTGNLTLGGATADVTNECTITTPLVISGGTLNLNGSGTVTPTSLTMSGGAEGGSQTLQVNGPLNWTAGNITGTVQFEGGSITGLNWSGILVNSGTLALSGNFYMYGGQLTNLASGTVNVAAGTFMGLENGAPVIENAGQFNVAGPGTTTINIPFFSTNAVAINGGTLTLGDGGTESGLFTVASGATLDLGGGTVSFGSGSSISGAGGLTVSSGTANLGGGVNAGGTCTFSGGTANVTGAGNITTPLVISGGTLNLNGSGIITPTSLTVSAGTEAGSQTMQVSGSVELDRWQHQRNGSIRGRQHQWRELGWEFGQLRRPGVERRPVYVWRATDQPGIGNGQCCGGHICRIGKRFTRDRERGPVQCGRSRHDNHKRAVFQRQHGDDQRRHIKSGEWGDREWLIHGRIGGHPGIGWRHV